MNSRVDRALLLGCLSLVHIVQAQENALVREAQRAYDDLDFQRAVTLAKGGLNARLSEGDRAIAYELLGFSYAAMDSAQPAIDAFRSLALLDPDREPDPRRVSPKITSLYGTALGQVLVVRRVRIDSTSFVAGAGALAVHFELSRAAHVKVSLIGNQIAAVVDSVSAAGQAAVHWDGRGTDGGAVPAGRYTLRLSAVSGREAFERLAEFEVRRGSVDTLPHLTRLPGYDELPEQEVPPRDWRAFGITVLYAGAITGFTVAFEQSPTPPGVSRRELLAVDGVTLLTGLLLSIRKPEPRPVEANIRYNRVVREQLARANAEIAAQNQGLRRQVRLTIIPLPSGHQ